MEIITKKFKVSSHGSRVLNTVIVHIAGTDILLALT
jgi:hypothetical protein